jgi:abequosyltransferase
MNNPVISICIPTYKRVDCLKTCLESIVEQFKNPFVRENVEVVISDNASGDGTESMVKEFQKEFSNIFYYVNSENIGVDRNIINTVEKAKGEFVWFLGDDDVLFPDALEYMLEILSQRKFKYCLVNCLGYDHNMQNPAVKQPNFAIQADEYYDNLHDAILKINQNDLVGYFCGLSIQVFDRALWLNWPNKQQYVGTYGLHMYTLLSAMKDQPFAMIAKLMVKVRAANIRWDTFPGLEKLRTRVRGTTKGTLWILEKYDIPHSRFAIQIRQNVNLFKSWIIGIIKKYIFKSQKSRDFIKRLLGKL